MTTRFLAPVITGVGCVTPVGADRASTWAALLAGQRAGGRLEPRDWHGLPPVTAPESRWIGAPAAGDFGKEDPLAEMITAAAADAANQAQLAVGGFEPERAGCILGTSKGDIVGLGRMALARNAASSCGEGIADWTRLWPHVANGVIADRWGLAGPRIAPVAACATGLVCVLRAVELIEQGVCDLVIAGAVDLSLHPGILAAFRRMGVLSARVDDPQAACRPFQEDRDGFFVGEGAAAFVIEHPRHAAARGVRPLARWGGGALLSDPSGLTSVDISGESLQRAIADTLRRAGVEPSEIGHINLHGTATRANDLAEAAGLRGVFGAGVENIPSVALKASLGHLLGAAGAVELAISVLAMAKGVLPPTPLAGPLDPDCRVGLSESEVAIGGYGLKISLGFGGHVAVGCLGAG